MTTGTITLILVSVSLSALAQICFKAGVGSASSTGAGRLNDLVVTLFTPGVMGGLALYGLGTLLWLTALGRVEVSQAYPFVGLGFLLTAVLGAVLFGDTLSASRLAGMALIVGGIVLVARS
jgi:multidrug transporter EmrE-like cation transporter